MRRPANTIMEQKRRLRILSKTWETDDTATFTLEPADGLPFHYKPGQYLSLIFGTKNGEQRRAYSFSSCPGVDEHMAITVKRVVNGEFSNRLLTHAIPGDLLDVAGPHGRFLLPDKQANTIFYIVAGSGITPVISHLKTLLLLPEKPQHPPRPLPRIVLYYANRDSGHTIFKAQLDRWIREFTDRFECLYFFSGEKNADHALFRRLNNGLLEQLLAAYFAGQPARKYRRDTFFYLCAPKAVMRMAEMTLRTLGFTEKNILKETFTPERHLPTRKPDTSRTHAIVASKGNERIEFQAFEGETILNAALRQGIALPYSCKSGVCFSCLARCVQGEVDVVFSDFTRREGPGQMVNTCIGYAVTGQVELVYE